MRKAGRWLLGLCFGALAAGPLFSAPLSIGDALSPDGIESMHLSPDARHIVALIHAKNASGVALVDSDTLATRFIVEPQHLLTGPIDAVWINESVIAVSTLQGSYAIDYRDGKTVSLGGRLIQKVATRTASGHDLVLVRRTRDWQHIDRVDVVTGRYLDMNFDMPGDPVAWVMNRNGVPLVVTTIKDGRWLGDVTMTHWYRSSLDAKWEKLASFPATAIDWQPVFVMDDGQSLAVRSELGRDTSAFFRYNIAERRLEEMLAGHPTQDLEAFRRDDGGDDFQAAVTRGMVPEIHWFEPRRAALQGAIDAALPNRVNRFQGDVDTAVLIVSYGDVDPGAGFFSTFRR